MQVLTDTNKGVYNQYFIGYFPNLLFYISFCSLNVLTWSLLRQVMCAASVSKDRVADGLAAHRNNYPQC